MQRDTVYCHPLARVRCAGLPDPPPVKSSTETTLGKTANARTRLSALLMVPRLVSTATGPWNDCAPAGDTKLSGNGPKSP